MLYLVGMLAWEVKVEGSRLRHMGERPGTLVFLNGRFLMLPTKTFQSAIHSTAN